MRSEIENTQEYKDWKRGSRNIPKIVVSFVLAWPMFISAAFAFSCFTFLLGPIAVFMMFSDLYGFWRTMIYGTATCTGLLLPVAIAYYISETYDCDLIDIDILLRSALIQGVIYAVGYYAYSTGFSW